MPLSSHHNIVKLENGDVTVVCPMASVQVYGDSFK